MDGWKKTTLGAVCEVIAGQSPKSSNYNASGDGLPFYQGKKEFGDKYIGAPTKWTTQITREAIAGDILMSVRAPVGPINFATERICIGRGLASIRAGEQVHREFLFYSLLSVQDQIKGSEGAVFASINKKQIETMRFSKPPLPEQERIVAILDKALAAIATAMANAKTNLANVRDMFESYLNVALDPSDRESKICPLEELTELGSPITYGVVKPGPEGGVPFVRGGDISHGKVRIGNLRTITKDVSEQYSRTLLRGGEILVSLVGQPGQVAVAPQGLSGANIARQVGMVRTKEGCNTDYIALYLRSPRGQTELGSYEGGSVQQVINLRDLRRVRIPLPNQRTQIEICETAVKVERQSAKLNASYVRRLEYLADLKQSLLHSAITGALTTDSKAADRTLSAAGV